MVEELSKELQRRLEQEDMRILNREVTDQLQKEEKYVKFHEWLKANGAKYDSIEYPVAFGKSGGLVGVAARRNIGPEEAYLFIPSHIIINDDKVLKSPVGFIISKHKDVFYEHADGEYLRLIFFITYELAKGEGSFWFPYFAITERTDLPCYWGQSDLDVLEDELLKAEIKEYQEDYEAEFMVLQEIANLYPQVVNVKEFTEDNFKLAFTMTVTRCFGWSLPNTMVIPLADCCNHFIIDNQYEMHNRAYQLRYDQAEKEGKTKEQTFNQTELNYFTDCKMRVNCTKHFQEDEKFEDKVEPPYKTKRYIKKLKMREYCKNLSREEFLYQPELKEKQIWELKYMSTSEDEDNDTSESEEEEDEDEEGKKKEGEEEKNLVTKPQVEAKLPKQEEELKGGPHEENKNGNELEQRIEELLVTKETPEDEIWKKNQNVPLLAKQLKPSKKKQRVYYTYQNNPDSNQQEVQMVVRKRVEARQPQNLIDLLIMQKSSLYEKEERMKVLKELDDEEWQKLTAEYDSSDEDDLEENFSWYKDGDTDSYFVLCTKYKNVYKKGDQVFHCYGRRTNRFLLLNYGFCLTHNKYNSLSFRVWINFNWQQEKERLLAEGKKIVKEEDGDSDKISKIIRLKKVRVNEEIFAYLRANLLNTYKGKNLSFLLISSPVDVEFELLVVACAINLMQGLLTSRFKTHLEVDQEMLARSDISMRTRFAIIHRMNAKDILTQNIRLCHILMRILIRFKDGKDFKNNYMEIVDEYEKPEEIMKHRLALRRYLRELVVNQKRILEAAKRPDLVKEIEAMMQFRMQMEREIKKQEEEEYDEEYEDEEEEEEQEKKEESKQKEVQAIESKVEQEIENKE